MKFGTDHWPVPPMLMGRRPKSAGRWLAEAIEAALRRVRRRQRKATKAGEEAKG